MTSGRKTQIRPNSAGAAQLLAVLKAKGWSQREAARLVGWSITRMHRLLSGVAEISAREAFQIQDELTDGEVSARSWTVDIKVDKRHAS